MTQVEVSAMTMGWVGAAAGGSIDSEWRAVVPVLAIVVPGPHPEVR